MSENEPKRQIIITPLEKVVRAGEAEYIILVTSPDGQSITHEEMDEAIRKFAKNRGASQYEIAPVDPEESRDDSAWKPEGMFRKPGSPPLSSSHPEQN